MLHKNVIEKIKQIEDVIEYDFFQCYEFDEFVKYYYDDDEYFIINFKDETLIITQNIEIECVNDDSTRNAFFNILLTLLYYD